MTYKRIYWRPDMGKCKGNKMFANIHILVGYNQGSIEDFNNMAAELRKTFPEAKDKDLICSHVTKSSYCDRFTLLMYNAYIEKKDYNDWGSYDGDKCDYYWA